MTILEDKYNKGKYNKDHKIEPQRMGEMIPGLLHKLIIFYFFSDSIHDLYNLNNKSSNFYFRYISF